MAGDLRLRSSQDLHEVADADLLVADEVQKPESGVVAESLKEPFDVVRLLCCHRLCIRLGVSESKSYSRLSRCLEAICQSSY